MRRNVTAKADAEAGEATLHLKFSRDDLAEIDSLVAKNPGILNRTSVGRALMRLGLRIAKKDPAQIVAPTA